MTYMAVKKGRGTSQLQEIGESQILWYNSAYMIRHTSSKKSDAGAYEDRAQTRRVYYADRYLPLQHRQYIMEVLGLLGVYEEQRLTDIKTHRDMVAADLRESVPLLSKIYPGVVFSPIGLSCQWVRDTDVAHFILSALGYEDRGQPAQFCALYDYASGIMAVVFGQLGAEQLAGSDENECARQVQKSSGRYERLFGKPPPFDHSVGFHDVLAAEQKQFTSLLRSDPSGRKLLLWQGRHIEMHCKERSVTECASLPLSGFQTSAFVLAGARFALSLCLALAASL